MPSDDVRLRGRKLRLSGPWPLGAMPRSVILAVGRQLVHQMIVGRTDITGDDFATMFAGAISGEHRESPLGIADVVLAGNAWSIKTVKAGKPFEQESVRLISGRNSPDFSSGIENPHADVQATGRAILSIWNARVNEALKEHDDLRIAVFIRNFTARQFVLFEEEAVRYATGDYEWNKNKRGNFEGYDKSTGEHKFTWQPHGAQFTVIRHVPGSAIRFSVSKSPPLVAPGHILTLAGFQDDWIEIVDAP